MKKIKKGEFSDYVSGGDYYEPDLFREWHWDVKFQNGTYLLREGVTYEFAGTKVTPGKDMYVTIGNEPPADAKEIIELDDYELPKMTN